MKTFLKLSLSAGLALALTAQAADPTLAIAGRAASLEQAVAAPHARNYRLLVLRSELMRITAAGADAEVRELLARARRGGAVVFACEKDLKALHLQPADLLPGVLAINGGDVWEHGAPSSGDRTLRSICS
jgi:hypothetical protein